MSSPYQPEPGCTARQRQLEQQVHDLRQQLRAAEKELGERRGRERREEHFRAAWQSTVVEARRQCARADAAEAASEQIAQAGHAIWQQLQQVEARP